MRETTIINILINYTKYTKISIAIKLLLTKIFLKLYLNINVYYNKLKYNNIINKFRRLKDKKVMIFNSGNRKSGSLNRMNES